MMRLMYLEMTGLMNRSVYSYELSDNGFIGIIYNVFLSLFINLFTNIYLVMTKQRRLTKRIKLTKRRKLRKRGGGGSKGSGKTKNELLNNGAP